jgi:hypothetical protein
VAKDAIEGAAALEAIEPAELACCGLVLEPSLEEEATYSVGQVRVDGLCASYCGTQKATSDNQGQAAYGGSDLVIVRGDYDALEKLPLPQDVRTAIRQARVFDAAAAEFRGWFASRRNYDVLSGRDARGRRHSGVLEQSWRIGGASGPEVAALEAFRADPGLRAVRACSTEAYGADAAVPAVVPRGARVQFQGVDPQAGPLVKFTIVEPHGTAH